MSGRTYGIAAGMVLRNGLFFDVFLTIRWIIWWYKSIAALLCVKIGVLSLAKCRFAKQPQDTIATVRSVHKQNGKRSTMFLDLIVLLIIVGFISIWLDRRFLRNKRKG